MTKKLATDATGVLVGYASVSQPTGQFHPAAATGPFGVPPEPVMSQNVGQRYLDRRT